MRYLTLFLFVFLGTSAIAQNEGMSDEVKEALEEKGYILKSIYFGGGSYYVSDGQITELNHLLDSIPNIRDFTVTVHSHTDNIGGAAYNEWLSQMRSESVIHELLLSEFKMNQIEIKDFGQFNPVFDNSTWEGREKNRRVDVIFWPVVF